MLCGSLFLGLACAAQNPTPTASESKGSELFQRVIANQKRTDQELDLFERIERTEIRKTGSDPKPAEVKAWRVFPAGVANDRIPLSAEGKPISAESYGAELQKLEKLLVWAMQQGPGQDEALAKLARKRKERNDLIEATHAAFIFTLAGHEMRGDRSLAKYSMVPNPKYKPTSRNAALFTRVSGFIWIDEESAELAKVEGEVSQDILFPYSWPRFIRAATSCRNATRWRRASGCRPSSNMISTGGNSCCRFQSTSGRCTRITAGWGRRRRRWRWCVANWARLLVRRGDLETLRDRMG